MKVLITGGAGFIGQRLARVLHASGHEIRILDNFSPQVHTGDTLPADLDGRVELIKADIRDRDALRKGLQGVEGIVQLAAETGTGQSMYEIERYYSVNVQGTAIMLDLLQNEKVAPELTTLVVASSRAIYGEGAYYCQEHGEVFPEQREYGAMTNRHFEPACPVCGTQVEMRATAESAPFKPMSVYGLTKQVQEQAILMHAKTNGLKGIALRYQNVYGPGQSLKNPYTGILAVFSNLARQSKKIEVYEDGLESRDFVYIDDVVMATKLALECQDGSMVDSFNVGTGIKTSVIEIANVINEYFGSHSAVEVSGKFRLGDIRHNVADMTKIKTALGFEPQVGFRQGINEFLKWASSEDPQSADAYEKSVEELRSKGLMGES